MVNAARKDPTGNALNGVKASFTNHLIGSGDVTGQQLSALLGDKKMGEAMGKVFNVGELSRMKNIASSLAKIKPDSVAEVGGVIDASTNKIIETVIRIAAAKHGGSLGGGSMGGSMQTANIASERAKTIMRNLTNVKARSILTQAIEDPVLFKELLMTPEQIKISPTSRSKLAPFLIGTGVGTGNTEEEK